MAMRNQLKAAIFFITTIFALPTGNAGGIDLHRLWENHCGDCHGHAGPFARKYLTVSEGVLQGRHHVDDLRQFMQNHYVVENEVDAVFNMLLAQAATPPRFMEECSNCHDTAADFVRDTLDRPAFDAVTFGTANSRSRPYLRFTVWLTAATRDPHIALAHELVHMLLDDGSHTRLPGNLMRGDTSPENVELNEQQCSKMRDTAQRNGLLG